jgi:hypothetical protein
VQAIDYPDVEILISDRHHDDDAIDMLAEALKDDRRVTISPPARATPPTATPASRYGAPAVRWAG